jgi:Putative Flp pilus-assembly TadE/G-like
VTPNKSQRRRRPRPGDERGQISILILAMTVIAATLIVGGVAVTSAQLSRMRLLDAADGAALDAADSLDTTAYQKGLDHAVAVSDETVRATAEQYLASRPLPVGMIGWWVAPGTGTRDGQTAVVRLTGEADLPLIGPALSALGGSVTITVESRARAELSP